MDVKELEIAKTKIILYLASSGTSTNEEIISMPHNLNEQAIRSYYQRKFERYEKENSKSLAFEISFSQLSGDEARVFAKIIAQEIFRFIQKKHPLKRIVLYASGKTAYQLCAKHCLGYLDYVAHRLKTPFVCVDVIIRLRGNIVVIKRSNPPLGWALPGGFVDYGESLEEAARREVREETGLFLKGLRQFHTYSNPQRDPRFHTITTVFTAHTKNRPRSGSDAAEVRLISPKDIKKLIFAFDHKKILQDYFRSLSRK